MGADGNQASTAGQGNGAAGDDHLLVEPGVVPALRDAFADAMSKVSEQIRLADSDLRITGWADDPVSADATAAFNARSVDGGGSALTALRAFGNELGTAVDTLDQTAKQYQASDEDNSVTVGKQEGTGG